MFMVWSETAKLGPSSTSGGVLPSRVWLRGPAAFPQDKLAFGLLQKTRPQRQQNHLVKSGFRFPLHKACIAYWRRLPAQRTTIEESPPFVKAPAGHSPQRTRCRLGASRGCWGKPTIRRAHRVNRGAQHVRATARPARRRARVPLPPRSPRATIPGSPRPSAPRPRSAQASRRPHGPSPRHT